MNAMNEVAAVRTDILLRSGVYFNFLTPHECAFTVDDIAHGLSQTCRFTGQTSEFYSVAQHSVIVSHLVEPPHQLGALFHDASEAMMGDIIRP